MHRLFVALVIAALVASCTSEGELDTPAADESQSATSGAEDEADQTPEDAEAVDGDEADPAEVSDVDDDVDPADLSAQADALPAVPETRDDLVASVTETVSATLEQADVFSVLITDEYGREIVAHNSDEPVMPASTLKNVTAAAALTTFGPEATFTTTVESTAAVDDDGVLDGDLLLVGSGDPLLATDTYARWVSPQRPHTPLEALVEDVVAAGVTQVAGDVIGVPDSFEGPAVPEGWPERYFDSFDARYIAGLTVDSGLETVLTYPHAPGDGDGTEPGGDDQSEDDGEQRASGYGDQGDPPGEQSDPEADEDTTEGSLADPAVAPDVRTDHAGDPAAHAASEFARLLDERGVEVGGVDTSNERPAPVVGQLGAVESPPMEQILRYAVQRSDNQISDGLFKAVGRARSGIGSFESGEQGLRQVLDHYGIDHSAAKFADGSGLSRDDRLTPRLLVELEQAMYTTEYANLWPSLMAVTGEPGTLQNRLVNTIAEGRFAGKTGTLRDVSALTGTVSGRNGQRYHLAVISNDPGDSRWISRTMADELILQLVADLDGCSVDRGGPENEIGLSDLRVEC